MHTRTRTARALLALLVLAGAAAAAPADAQRRGYGGEQNEFRLRLGLFEPDGDSTYWEAKEIDFTGSPEDFEDVGFGADYVRWLSTRLGAQFSLSGTSAEEEQAYRFFVDELGNDIFHTTTLDTVALTAGLVFNLTARHNRFVPYLGAGGGLYSWELTENGEFIDFASPDLEIFPALFQENGDALGWYYLAGINVGLTRAMSFFAEARWHNAEDELGGEFEGACDALLDFGGFDSCDLDLSGREISGGISWRF